MALLKLVVYIPSEAFDKVRLALGAAGAGRLGNYDYCGFATKGTGYYRPLDGSKPYKGEEGKIEEADEVRFETICKEEDLPRILHALRQSHPYEEVAYDLTPLLNHPLPPRNDTPDGAHDSLREDKQGEA